MKIDRTLLIVIGVIVVLLLVAGVGYMTGVFGGNTATPTPIPSAVATATPTAQPTNAPTTQPTVTPTTVQTPTSTATATPTAIPSPSAGNGVQETSYGYYITYPPFASYQINPNPNYVPGSGSPSVTPSPSPTATPDVSFAGVWDTNWNTMVLTANGNNINGTYDFRGGLINGTVSGKALTGTWTQNNGAGDILFNLSDDGNTFAGWWRYGHSIDPNASWGGDWTGTRVS